MSMAKRSQAEDSGVCDREPIHIPGGIQPHGALVVVTEPTLMVTQASENFAALTSVSAAQIVGKPLATLLDEVGLQTLRDALAHDPPEEPNPLRLMLNGRNSEGPTQKS